MPRTEAEALALKWKEARSLKDYATADAIRTQLRAVGMEAENLAAEIGGGRPPARQPADDAPVAEPRGGRHAGMPRKEAEALAMRWREAKRAQDYATADGIRTQLRAVGIEAEDLAHEIEVFGPSDEHDALDVSDAPPPPYEPDKNDPLAYREHMSAEAKALFQPTEAAARHKDGGTGGLLTLNYSLIPDLPKEVGFKVTSGKAHASADALTAYKEMMRQEEEATRRQIAERNTQTLRVRRS